MAQVGLHRHDLAALSAEYLAWVAEGMAREWGASVQGRPETDDGLVEALCSLQVPHGRFYLLQAGGQPAGMGGLRRCPDGWAEIKRFYVRPAWRGQGLARVLLAQLIQDSREAGCPGLRLDTAPFMRDAHRLYEQHGFEDCPAYEGTEVPATLWPRWRFMQRRLAAG